jgi:adenylate cyclase
VLLTAAVVAALLAANVAAWQAAGLVLPLATGLVLAAGLLGLHLLLAYRQATSARQRLARLFGQYVPPELVDVMSLAPERYTMHGRGAELSVLFADVQGFSGLAERMPPAELGMMMNTVFSHLSDVVHEYRGTLDKFIGDAVMAFWGAPLDDPDHASHAVAAAIAMQQRLPALHAELAARGWPALQIHIGIHSGSMVVGDMGSRHRRAYTVMGDAVNLAARLQALCSEHRLGLLVGEATRRALGPRLCLALGSLPIRGRGAPEQVWHPLPWPAGQNPLADALARDWDRLRAMVDTGRLGEAAALLDALSVQPGMAALCRWQRGRLAASAGPLADRPPALR